MDGVDVHHVLCRSGKVYEVSIFRVDGSVKRVSALFYLSCSVLETEIITGWC